MYTITEEEYNKVMRFLCDATCEGCVACNACDNPTCVINRINDILFQHIEIENDFPEENDLPF